MNGPTRAQVSIAQRFLYSLLNSPTTSFIFNLFLGIECAHHMWAIGCRVVLYVLHLIWGGVGAATVIISCEIVNLRLCIYHNKTLLFLLCVSFFA